MEKKLINYNKEAAKMAKQLIIEILDTLNNYSDVFYSKDISFLEDIVKQGRKKLQNKLYQTKLYEICNNFGVDYNKAKLWAVPPTKYDLVKEMAYTQTQLEREAIGEISLKLMQVSIELISKTIKKKDGKFILDKNYENTIKEHYSFYTDNEKEKKVVDTLNKILELTKEIEKFGVTIQNINKFINSDNTLSAYNIKHNLI